MESKITILELAEKLNALKSAVVFSHTRPDGDTIGAGLAILHYLKVHGVQATLVCDSPIPEKYSFLHGMDNFSTTIDTNVEAFIAVDSANPFRLGTFREPFLQSGKKTFNIDHHISNDSFATVNYVVDNAASTSEILVELYKKTNCPCPPEVANYLLMGILTDTGHFSHQNVTQNTLEMAAFLLSKGANLHNLQYNLFKKQSAVRANLFALTLNTLQYFADGQIAVLLVSQENLKKAQATPELTEGFVDYAMTIDTVEVGVCMLETGHNKYKISLRSKGKVNVNAVAALFGGGGHVLASGCMLFGTLDEIVEKLRLAIQDALNNEQVIEQTDMECM